MKINKINIINLPIRSNLEFDNIAPQNAFTLPRAGFQSDCFGSAISG